ncbi:MAG: deoxyribodipyrimidine photo-lyase [Caldilineaceae bacterium]
MTPSARRRDARAARELGQVRLEFTPGLTIRPLDAVRKDDGAPYTVYTPFSKRWKSHPPLSRAQILPAPKRINTPADVDGVAIPGAPCAARGRAISRRGRRGQEPPASLRGRG